MHKQKVLFRNSLLVLAVMLCIFAAFAALIMFFASPVYADEGDDLPSEPQETNITENVILDENASKNSEVVFTMPQSWLYGTLPESWKQGSEYVLPMPRAKYEGTDSDGNMYSVGFSLKLNEEQIVSGLTASGIVYYINKYMPAGEYEMILAYPQVIASSYTEWWNNNAVVTTDETVYSGVDISYRFNVLPAPIPDSIVADVTEKLTGEAFDYVYDGNVHFFADDIKFDVLEKGTSVYDRGEKMEGVYWSEKECDKYFGGFSITYNLYRMQNNHYHTSAYLAGEEEDLDCAVFSPRDPGKYTVYYQLSADNYVSLADVNDDSRRDYVFTVTIFGIVDIPSVPTSIYTGIPQKGFISDTQYYTVDAYNGWTDVGTYKITLRLREPGYYMWEDQTVNTRTETATANFTITRAANDWIVVPDVVRWVEGEYNADENTVNGEALFGTVMFEITDADGNIVYNSEGINELASLKAGYYNFTAHVSGSDNYSVLQYSQFIRVLEKQGLPWWGTLCIVLGALLLVALIILILYKKGVFRLLNDKIVLAIRTKATIDATIAAVRANKVAEASRASVAEAEAKDRAEEQQKARRIAAEQARNKSHEEKMAALEAKAQATADRAEAMRLKAEAMQARIQSMRARVASKSEDSTDTPSTEVE